MYYPTATSSNNPVLLSAFVVFCICCLLAPSVSHAHSWKLLKPHMFAIIQDVLFPLMCCSDVDEDLFTNDPHEYIRVKFGECTSFVIKYTYLHALRGTN